MSKRAEYVVMQIDATIREIEAGNPHAVQRLHELRQWVAAFVTDS
jgi:hypothetical protein